MLDSDVKSWWAGLRARLIGRLAPDAQALVRDSFDKWFDDGHVVCDARNNPPSVQVQGNLAATVYTVIDGKHVYWNLMLKDGSAVVQTTDGVWIEV